MKKILFSLVLLGCTTAFAQKSFQGKIVYELSYPGTELDANTMAMMPKEMTLYVKNEKARSEMQMGAMGSTVSIVDNKAKTSVALMDMMGQKMAIKSTAEDLEKAKGKEPEAKVTLLDETKEIAGYKCKKAEIELQDAEKTKLLVYYTSEIGGKSNNWNNPQYKGIDGFLMEYEMLKQGIRMKMSVKTVSKEDVDDAKFAVPSGYQEMTQDQLMKMMTGGK